MRSCPALLIAAPASGQGKTLVTAALAHFHRRQGRRVRIFKCGPDFLDPMILERASGAPVYQLDLWMAGEQHCRKLLYDAAGKADLILIEGVMGLFDGERSSANLAILFGIPVLAVIDGSAMAQSFGAIAYGLANYRKELPFAGVFANAVAGDSHYAMLRESLPDKLSAFGWLPRDEAYALPERHLGLVQADEIADLDFRIARAAASLQDIPEELPPPMVFLDPNNDPVGPALEGIRIAVARDAAFAFLYRANLDLLCFLGAEVLFFSPLDDNRLPVADALYLPGGYPELYLEKLAENLDMKAAVRAHHEAKKPIVAECGGMMFLVESVTDRHGLCAEMVGLVPARVTMRERLANLGMHSAETEEGEFRGHTFHYSKMTCDSEPFTYSRTSRHQGNGEPIYRADGLFASYVHWYFPSNSAVTARLFRS